MMEHININILVPVLLVVFSFLAYVVTRKRGNKALADVALMGLEYSLKNIVRELDAHKKELQSKGTFDSSAGAELKRKAFDAVVGQLTQPAKQALKKVLGITDREISEMIEHQVKKNKEAI